MKFVQSLRASKRIGPQLAILKLAEIRRLFQEELKAVPERPGARGETNLHFFPVQ
jgi:hypothetical protein